MWICVSFYCMDIMILSGQKKGGCGHIMARFGTHIKCAHCHDNGSRNWPLCVGKRGLPCISAYLDSG